MEAPEKFTELIEGHTGDDRLDRVAAAALIDEQAIAAARGILQILTDAEANGVWKVWQERRAALDAPQTAIKCDHGEHCPGHASPEDRPCCYETAKPDCPLCNAQPVTDRCDCGGLYVGGVCVRCERAFGAPIAGEETEK